MKIKGRVLSCLGNTQPCYLILSSGWVSSLKSDVIQCWKVRGPGPRQGGVFMFWLMSAPLPRPDWHSEIASSDIRGQDTRCQSLSSLSRPHLQTMDPWNTWSQREYSGAYSVPSTSKGLFGWVQTDVDDVSPSVPTWVWYHKREPS